MAAVNTQRSLSQLRYRPKICVTCATAGVAVRLPEASGKRNRHYQAAAADTRVPIRIMVNSAAPHVMEALKKAPLAPYSFIINMEQTAFVYQTPLTNFLTWHLEATDRLDRLR